MYHCAMDRVREKARRGTSALSSALQAAACELGLPEFKMEQKKAIESVFCGKDVLVTLSTGFRNQRSTTRFLTALII